MASELKPCLSAFIKWTKQHHAHWNLSPVYINGQFSKFMDPDTDTAWMGFEAAWNTRPAPASVEDELYRAGMARKRNPDIAGDMPDPAPAATDTGLVTVGYAHRGTIGLLLEGAVSKAVIVPKAGGDFKTPVVMRENADERLAEKDVIIRSHLATIATLNADNAAWAELCKLTFAIQHNPNCPDRFLIRLPGKSGCIDLKPYADQLGFRKHETNDVIGAGKTLAEAWSAARGEQ
ncbi:hypothetical protein WKW50_05415 [Ochrobactrum sp. GPK 3]